MRMLFTSRPTFGHIQPLLPLVQAARASGHDVLFGTAEEALPELTERGISAVAVGKGRDPGLSSLMGVSTVPLEQHRMFAFTKMFAGNEMKLRLDDLLPLIRSYRPNIMVHEIAELAAPLAATIADIPFVSVGFGPLLDLAVADAAETAAGKYWQAHGQKPARWAGLYRDLYVDPCPPALQVPEIGQLPAVQPMRTQDANGGTPPGWIADVRMPLVYATFGTIYNRNVDAFRRVIHALASLPVDVIATVGKNSDTAMFGIQPSRIRIEQYVPQQDLLGHCRLVVAHGGAGTMLGALAFGVPLLLLPQGADQLFNAERCCSAGVALMLRPEEASAESIASATSRLLGDPAIAAKARAVAAQMRAMPSPKDAMARIERLVV